MDSADSMEAAPQGGFVTGQRVGNGRFELSRCLGRGGMGVVWLARDHQLREPVALKFLAAEIQSDPVAIDDLRRETQRCRKLSHPNIVRIHDLHELPGEPMFLSMEYVDGSNLADLRSHGLSEVLSWEQVRPMVEQLCDALDYAHGEQVIHRDLKPGNLMLDRQNRLKLADFGIAAFLHDGEDGLAQHQIRLGTLSYMSPQQMEGLPPSTSDDIYSLGATLYELLTSTPPFPKGDLLELVPKAKPDPIAERLRELKIENEVPKEEAAMVMACLAKEPAKRPASARAVAEWVGIQIKRRPKASVAVPEVKEFAAVESAPGAPTADVGEEFGQYKMRRNLVRIGLLAAGVGMVGLGAGYWWMSHIKSTKATPVTSETPTTNDLKTSVTDSSQSGVVDTSFDAGVGVKGDIQEMLIQSDGSVLIAGAAVRQEDGKGLSVMRFRPDGTPDATYTPRIKGKVHSLVQQPDGKLVIGGDFSAIDGEPCNTVGRLLPDGRRDPGFNPGEGGDVEVRWVTLQHDGKILVGGNFKKFNKTNHSHMVRLNADGSVDETFRPRAADNTVWTMLEQPDGKVLVGGSFTKLGNLAHSHLVRLNSDGSIDHTFYVNTGNENTPRKFALLSDGKILVVGGFAKFQGQARAGLVRLLPDGKLDESFPPLGDPKAMSRHLFVLPDQSFIISGGFALPSSKGPLHRLAKFRPDGTLDEKLDWGTTVRGINTIGLTPSGQLVMQGALTNIFGVNRTNLVRLNLPH